MSFEVNAVKTLSKLGQLIGKRREKTDQSNNDITCILDKLDVPISVIFREAVCASQTSFGLKTFKVKLTDGFAANVGEILKKKAIPWGEVIALLPCMGQVH